MSHFCTQAQPADGPVLHVPRAPLTSGKHRRVMFLSLHCPSWMGATVWSPTFSQRLRGGKRAHPLVDRRPDVVHGLHLRVRNDPAVAAIGVSLGQLHAYR
jgi:hypothetical protein